MALGLVMPVARQQFFDANGDPLAGGKLYAYVAGTTTPTDLYTDAAVTIPHAWPLILDAGGVASGVYLSQSVAYKLILKDDNDVTIWTQDNVSLAPVADLEAVQDGGLTITGQAANDILVASSSTQVGVLHSVANGAVVTDAGGAPTYHSKFLDALLSLSATASPNSGTGETTLHSYSVPAATLGTDGWALEVLAAVTFANNANSKTVKVKFGSTTIYTYGGSTYQNFSILIHALIVRTGATAQVAVTSVVGGEGSGGLHGVSVTAPAETLAGAVTLVCTGQGGATSDVTQVLSLVRLVGVPT